MKINKEKKSSLRPISTNWYYLLKIFGVILMIPNFLVLCSPFNTMLSDTALLILRMISRASMPIFAYELVECFHYTKSRKKHFLKLLLLTIVSEPLRDFAIDGTLINAEKQSICYDLLLSWIMLTVMNVDFKKFFSNTLFSKSDGYARLLSNNHRVLTGLAFCFIAIVTMANYNYLCVALIALLEIAYNSKHKRVWQFIFLLTYILMFKDVSQVFIAIDIVLILIAETKFKNKEEKQTVKFFENKFVKLICTVAYPLQLLIFTIIRLV